MLCANEMLAKAEQCEQMAAWNPWSRSSIAKPLSNGAPWPLNWSCLSKSRYIGSFGADPTGRQLVGLLLRAHAALSGVCAPD
jgi:hypothetical protein